MESNTVEKVKERPILFKGEMVRAILAGRKTQTRRLMKPQPHEDWRPLPEIHEIHKWNKTGDDFLLDRYGGPIPIGHGFVNEEGDQGYVSKLGKPGDRLWVKETFCYVETLMDNEQCFYRADENEASVYQIEDASDMVSFDPKEAKWKPSLFMPRAASRITLEIIGLRVERLNEISREDAASEGVCLPEDSKNFPDWYKKSNWPEENFRALWEKINGPGSWAKNPWVWVIEFRRIE